MPYVRNGIYVPVTAKEQWSKAIAVKGYPLTRAVADQAHLFAVKSGIGVVFQSHWPLPDYKGFSAKLDRVFSYKNAYPQVVFAGWKEAPAEEGSEGSSSSSSRPLMMNNVVVKKMVSGSHKYWLVSAFKGLDPRAINYGFYTKDPKIKDQQGGLGGKYLYGKTPDMSCWTMPGVWFMQQALGGRHNAMHWDYSQLCQYMKNFKVGGKDQSMADAITSASAPGHDAIWDEDKLIDKSILPW